MHVNQIKEVVRILTGNGETNKEIQSCTLGYVVGIEAPISIDMNNADDNIEWSSFFNDIPGEINEHFLINLQLAQEVANVTLKYRQAVANGSDDVESLASQFLKLTGSAFGMLGNQGTIRQIRKVIKQDVEYRRNRITSEQQRRAQNNSRRDVSKEGFWDTIAGIVDVMTSPRYDFTIAPHEIGKPGVILTIKGGKYHPAKTLMGFVEHLYNDLGLNESGAMLGTQNSDILKAPAAGQVPLYNINQLLRQMLLNNTRDWRGARFK